MAFSEKKVKLLEDYNEISLKMKSKEVPPAKKMKKVKKNFKSIQQMVFNQDKSTFALIWSNVVKEVEI